jgi:hypothetical protein
MYFLYKNEYGMFKPAEFTVKRGLKQQGEKWRGKPIWGICIHTHTEKCHNETPCTTIINKNVFKAGCWRLTSVILATQKAEIRRITV